MYQVEDNFREGPLAPGERPVGASMPALEPFTASVGRVPHIVDLAFGDMSIVLLTISGVGFGNVLTDSCWCDFVRLVEAPHPERPLPPNYLPPPSSSLKENCVEVDYGVPDDDEDEEAAMEARKSTGGGIAQFFTGSAQNRASKRVRGSYFSDRGMTQCDDF